MKLQVAYSEEPHSENVDVYANKKLKVTCGNGQCRKVVITVENYCPEYIHAYVESEHNFLDKEELGSHHDSEAYKARKVKELTEFTLWQLERSGIDTSPELEDEIKTTILEGIESFEKGSGSHSKSLQNSLEGLDRHKKGYSKPSIGNFETGKKERPGAVKRVLSYLKNVLF